MSAAIPEASISNTFNNESRGSATSAAMGTAEQSNGITGRPYREAGGGTTADAPNDGGVKSGVVLPKYSN